MKKIVPVSLLLLAAAGTAFAAATIPSDGTSIGSQSFKTSNSVTLIVASVVGTSLDPGGFSSGAYHASGNRSFATNSGQPKIYWSDKTASSNLITTSTVTCTSSTTFGPDLTAAGWTSL